MLHDPTRLLEVCGNAVEAFQKGSYDSTVFTRGYDKSFEVAVGEK